MRRSRARVALRSESAPAMAFYTVLAINASTTRVITVIRPSARKPGSDAAVAIRGHPLVLELAFRRLVC